MDRFREMEIFLSVVDEGSFVAAARREGISPPSVTRTIAALEQRIGLPLVSRNSHSMNLTEAGERFLLDCRHILNGIKAAEAAVTGQNTAPAGLIRLSAPMIFGGMFVAPLVRQYLEQFPAVRFSCLFVDRETDMLNEGIDICIKIGHLELNAGHSINIGETRQVLCASPSYFQKHARPTHPEQLLDHNIINCTASALPPAWQFQNGDRLLTIAPAARMDVTCNRAAVSIALDACGITRAFLYQVADDVRRGQLELLLEDYELPPLPVNLIFRERIKSSSSIYSFSDFLLKNLPAAARGHA